MRKLYKTVLILIVTTLLFGCAEHQIITNDSEVELLGDESKKVVVWHTYSDEETRVFEKIVIPAFSEQYPEIQIESVRQTHSNEYRNALFSRLRAGKSPDLIRMDYSWLGQFIDEGLLQELNHYEGFDTIYQNVLPNLSSGYNASSQVFAMPVNVSIKAGIYNQNILQQLNINHPPSTMTELIDIVKQNNLLLGMSGLSFWSSYPYFQSLGGSISSADFTQMSGYFDSEQSIAAMKTLLELYDSGYMHPQAIDQNADLWNEIYSSDRLFMIDDGPWYYSIMLSSSVNSSKIEEGTATAVFLSNTELSSIVGGEALVLSSSSMYKEETWTFMSWMLSDDTQLLLYEAGLIPTKVNVLRDIEQQLEQSNHYDLNAFVEGLERGYLRPFHSKWDKVEDIYNDAIEDIFIRKYEVEKVMKDAAIKMEKSLQE